MSIKSALQNVNIEEMLSMVKETLGLDPQEVEDNVYIPSTSSLLMAAPDKSNYDNSDYDSPYSGNKKILMVCTEQERMTMENGKIFSTGNQPIEMMVPMLHFNKAGFDVDVFTPTGGSVKIEQWAMPKKDEHVKAIYDKYQPQFEQPNSLADFVKNDMANSDDYIAIFIPGGHGAMLGLPEDKNLGEILRWGDAEGLFTLSLCHGPAALLAANLDRPEGLQKASDSVHSEDLKTGFLFKGYDIVAFTDIVDKHMPKTGYLPGNMPWYFNEKLEKLGVTITNTLATGHTHQDRKLITGDGPLAANDFGKLCVSELLKAVK